MALIDFFGVGGGVLPASATGNVTATADSSFGSGYAVEATASNGAGSVGLGAIASTSNSLFVGFRYKESAAAVQNNADQFGIKQGGVNNYLSFRWSTDDTVGVSIGTSFGGSATEGTIGPISRTGDGSYWEIEWLSHASTGILRIRIDGNIPTGWTDITSGDTEATGGGDTSFSLIVSDETLRTPYVGDIVVWDDSGGSFDAFQGPMSVPFLAIDGSGESDFTGDDMDSTDNHLRVDAVPMGTDGYIESSTSTDRQVFTTDDSALGSTGSIEAVKAKIYGLEPSAGSQDLDIGVREGSTDSSLTTVTLTTSESAHESGPVTTQPDGGGAWDSTSIAGAEVVMEVP